MVSIAAFPECEQYQKFLKDLARQEEEDAWAEARRDMYKLDDNEDSLKYRGGY
jgi:hypothetical protein